MRVVIACWDALAPPERRDHRVRPPALPLRWLFRFSLLAHPPDVRRRFGNEMERILTDDIRAARAGGSLEVMRVLLRSLLDIVRAGLRERFAGDEANAVLDRHQRRRGSGMDHLQADMRFAIRSLSRRPGFTLVAVLTLALGIGATTAIFSVVNGVLLRSLPFADSERLVRLWETVRDDPSGPFDGSNSPVTFQDYQASATTIETMALFARSRPTLTGLGEPEIQNGARVTPDFFRVMRAEPELGVTFTAEQSLPGGPLAVVISDAFWRERLGGRTDVLGQTLELNGELHEIVGVAPPGFGFPDGTRLWMAVRNNDENCNRGCVYLNTVGRLRDGVTVEQAQAEMHAIADRLSLEFPNAMANRTMMVASLQDTVVGDVRAALLVLLGAVGLVLLIACANVANLLIARGATRTDEMAVRVALGAGRRRILSQLLTESMLLAMAGCAAGVALAAAGVTALRELSPGEIPRLEEVGLDATAILFAVGLSALTALLFGFMPALQLLRTPVASVLRQDAARTVGARRGLGRGALLAGEVALSLVLLVGAGLLLRSFASMQRVDTGFLVEDIAQFSLSLPESGYPSPDDAVRFFGLLHERLEAQSSVGDAALVVGAPLSDFALWTSFERTDMPPPAPGESSSAAMRIVDENLFGLLDIEVVAGRPFASTDRQGAQPVAIINQRLAREFFGDDDPIGRRLRVGISVGYPEEAPRTIVGIVEDVRTSRLTGDPDPELYVPYAQSGSRFATLVVRSAITPAAALSAARAEIAALDARLPMRDPGALQKLLDGHTARPRFYLLLLSIFATLAIALAAVGLYGVVAYLVAQRSREIGVRIALGAGAADVVRLVVRQGFGPALIGAAAGLAIAFAGSRIMESLLFGVTPGDPLTFAGTTAALLAVAFLACLVPAGRATRIPPASALKAER